MPTIIERPTNIERAAKRTKIQRAAMPTIIEGAVYVPKVYTYTLGVSKESDDAIFAALRAIPDLCPEARWAVRFPGGDAMP